MVHPMEAVAVDFGEAVAIGPGEVEVRTGL